MTFDIMRERVVLFGGDMSGMVKIGPRSQTPGRHLAAYPSPTSGCDSRVLERWWSGRPRVVSACH